MLLARVVEASTVVAGTRSRLKKMAALAELFEEVDADQARLAVSYLTGTLPQGRIGLGPALLGSLELSVAPTDPSLTLAETDAAFAALADISGPRSAARRKQALTALFGRAGDAERAFLRRLIVGELRQGALEGVMAEALARATDTPSQIVRRAVMLAGDPAEVAAVLLAHGSDALSQFRLQPGKPLQAMLASPTEDIASAMAALGEARLEYKLDGARVQVHRFGDDVRVFSRRLNDVTASVPEVVELAHALDAASFILDGEVIAMHKDGRPHPFQVTMKRFGRRLDVEALRTQLPLTTYFFDCLYLDGEPLIDAPTRTRCEALAGLVAAEARVPHCVTADLKAAQEFVSQAFEDGHEGAMAKALDATYEAGSRGASWLKIKQVHSLDLVVLAAEWGSGRRKGWLSNLHLGARSDDGFVMLGKTFKGLTDKLLAWQTEALLALETHRDDYTVYVKPELVVEIAFNDLQASPHYPGGLALRFARVKRYRDDKGPGDADTMETVRALAPPGIAAA